MGLLEPSPLCRGLKSLVLGGLGEMLNDMEASSQRQGGGSARAWQAAFAVWTCPWEALSLLSESHPLIFSLDN